MYLVRCTDASLYTGIAKDVHARVASHNAGRGAAYTRARRPVRLVFQINGMTRSQALKEEARIKSLDRQDKVALLRRTALAAAFLWTLTPWARAVPVFNKENAIILPSITAQSFTGTYPTLRMYYLPAISSGAPHASSGTMILSATSADGVSWAADAGVRVGTHTTPSVSASSITGCAVQQRVDGSYRMLYSIVSTTGAFRIHTATSADGLAWGNQAAIAVDGAATYVGVPRVVVLDSGDWRLFYTRDSNGGDNLADRQIYTARSSDEGATWGASSVAVSTLAYESGTAKLTDGRVRLFYTQPAGSASSATVIVSALSSDALASSFSLESGARISTPAATGGLSFPVPVRSTDSFRWRLYYTFYETAKSTGDLRSALTGAPAPSSLSPSTVYNSGSANTVAITGEVFSTPAPTVSISQGAVTILGTGVSSSDDQHITATFATQNQTLGPWDLTVTNADGSAATLTGALTLDFPPGSIVITNNLLRPRQSTPTSVDITIFNAGRVSARVYDSEGREIRSLYDDDRAAGSFTVTWDGKDASGSTVSSGVYVILVKGPKISSKNKVVLIR